MDESEIIRQLREQNENKYLAIGDTVSNASEK